MTTNSLHFVPLSQITPVPTDTFRCTFHTQNIYKTYLTVESLFKYTNNNSQFNITDKYVTLVHFGTDVTTHGIDVTLTRRTSDTNPLEIGLRYGNSTTWTEVPGSFYSLPTTDISYMLFFTFDRSNSTPIVGLSIVKFDDIILSGPDFSFSYHILENITPDGALTFGSSHENIDSTGYISTDNYNSYIAQNIEILYPRTWSVVLPVTSTTATQYAMFNTAYNSYSLYSLNKSKTSVPSGTTNLGFQLDIPTSNNSLSNLTNTASNPPTTISFANTINNVNKTLPDIFINSNTSLDIVAASTIACLLEGTEILTPNGYKLIESLNIGDEIVTHDGRIKPIISTYIFQTTNNIKPYKIPKGEYGCIKDLYLSRGHSILVDNSEFCWPFKMDDLKESEDEHPYTLIYYCLMTDDYLRDTLVANGVAVETWAGWTPLKNFGIDMTTIIYNNKGNRILQKKSLDII
jgi:Hint domain